MVDTLKALGWWYVTVLFDTIKTWWSTALYESLRDFYDLSCPEIDWILKRVNDIEPNLEIIHNPVSCGRITGKGFGRCVYAILRESDVEKFKQKLAEYEKIFGFHPSCYEVSTADGAHIVS